LQDWHIEFGNSIPYVFGILVLRRFLEHFLKAAVFTPERLK
jgi:hypothetical protein